MATIASTAQEYIDIIETQETALWKALPMFHHAQWKN